MDASDNDKRQVLLVLRSQAGDRNAFDRLIARHQRSLYGYLINILQDGSLAEEAMQSTLILVFRKLKWLRDPTRFRGWMFRIATRVAFRLAKRKRRRNEASNIDDLASVAVVEQSLRPRDWQDLIPQIPDWLDQLSHRGREVLVLHYLQGFTVPRVADILDIPLGTAKSRISYALTCLRKITNKRKKENDG